MFRKKKLFERTVKTNCMKKKRLFNFEKLKQKRKETVKIARGLCMKALQ